MRIKVENVKAAAAPPGLADWCCIRDVWLAGDLLDSPSVVLTRTSCVAVCSLQGWRPRSGSHVTMQRLEKRTGSALGHQHSICVGVTLGHEGRVSAESGSRQSC